MKGKANFVMRIVAVVLILFLPIFFKQQHLFLFDIAQIHGILAISLAFTVGYAGRLSIAHPVFYGAGAYITGLMMIAGYPFLLAVFLAGLASSIIALAVGFPSLRLKGIYFAIVTLSLTIIFEMILNNWVSLTHGPSGLLGIPVPSFMKGSGLKLSYSYHFLISLFSIVIFFIMYRIIESEIGRTMIIIREKNALAKVMGINTLKYDLFNFCTGAFFASVAGSLYSIFIRYLHPTDFGMQLGFDILAMVVIGGTNGIFGPFMGSFFITFFPELLGIEPSLMRIVYGIAIIGVVVYMPKGFEGILRKFFLKKESVVSF
jgi:branched-chain amino acid transport system permease protein